MDEKNRDTAIDLRQLEAGDEALALAEALEAGADEFRSPFVASGSAKCPVKSS